MLCYAYQRISHPYCNKVSLCDITEYVICREKIGKICLTIGNIFIQPVAPVFEVVVIPISRMFQALYMLCDHCDFRGRMPETAIEKLVSVVLNEGSPLFLRELSYYSF